MTLHDPAHLLDHAVWLRSLAASLVGDRATADDLVQETYAAALRRPPAADRPVRPWLARVLRNAARFRWRSDVNRSRREAALASVQEEATPTSAELLERHEVQQLLARLVGELEEPYREAILLRFAEGMAPKDIARRLGIPAGTARWRISEGIARLRTRLDAIHEGDRKAWLAALSPLIARPVTNGALVAIVALAIALAVSLLVVVLAIRGPEAERARESVAASVPHRARVAARAASALLEVVSTAQPGAPRRHLAGRVIDAATDPGSAAAEVLVTLTQDGVVREQRTDHDGRFDFGSVLAAPLTVSADTPGHVATILHLDPRDPEVPTEDLKLALTPCVASLWGFVRDVDGNPIAGARVLREDVIGATSDATGAYEVCALPTATEVAQLLITIRADGYGAVHALPAPKGRVRRDFLLTPEAIITGRVVDEAGAPVAAARVMLEADSDGTAAYDELPAPATALTDATGSFEISGIRAGRVRAIAASVDAITMPVSLLAIGGEARTITLRTQPTGAIVGRVLVAGRPAAGARVTANVPDLANVATSSPGFVAAGAGTLTFSAVAQTDGSFEIPRVPVGRIALEVSGYRLPVPVMVDVRPGSATSIALAVEALTTIRGFVRRDGAVVPHARVSLNGPSKVGTTADGTGAYVIAGLEPGRYLLHADDTRMGGYLDTTIDLPAAGELARDLNLASGARVSGMVVDAAGAPVAGAFVALALPSAGPAPSLPMGDLGECVTAEDGRFSCGQLAGGGSYVAEVFTNESMRIPLRFAVAPTPVEVRDAHATVDGLQLVVERSNLSIAGRVVDLAGAPVSGVNVQLVVARDVHRWAAQPQTITNARGGFSIPGLPAGMYSIVVSTPEGIRHEHVAVAAGTTNLAIQIDLARCDEPGAVADRTSTEPGGISVRPTAPVTWDDRVDLVGWTVPTSARLGEDFELAVVYRARGPLARPWKAFVHLDGPVRISGDHALLEGRCPTTTWRAGDYFVDRIGMRATTSGRYAIHIGFFRGPAPRWTNLPLSAAPAAMRADFGQLLLGTVTVE